MHGTETARTDQRRDVICITTMHAKSSRDLKSPTSAVKTCAALKGNVGDWISLSLFEAGTGRGLAT